VHPDARIDALRGCFALERGLLVYCFEDPGGKDEAGAKKLEGVYGAPAEGVAESPDKVGTEHVIGLAVATRKSRRHFGSGWPYLPDGRDDGTEGRPAALAAVPYYTWSNRGPSEMRVWLPEFAGRETSTTSGL